MLCASLDGLDPRQFKQTSPPGFTGVRLSGLEVLTARVARPLRTHQHRQVWAMTLSTSSAIRCGISGSM